jgi:hypothetical protein
MKIKSHFTGLALAALLIAGAALPACAEDAAAPKDQPAPPPAATTQPEAPPPSVPRPSIVPKAAEPPPAAPVADEPPARPQRRYAHRHHWRHGYYRTAYWEPFPVYWPHLYHSRLYWSRAPWFRF